MCGFAGYIHNYGTFDKEEVIHKMADRIKHRGPDDAHYYIDDGIALGFWCIVTGPLRIYGACIWWSPLDSIQYRYSDNSLRMAGIRCPEPIHTVQYIYYYRAIVWVCRRKLCLQYGQYQLLFPAPKTGWRAGH